MAFQLSKVIIEIPSLSYKFSIEEFGLKNNCETLCVFKDITSVGCVKAHLHQLPPFLKLHSLPTSELRLNYIKSIHLVKSRNKIFLSVIGGNGKSDSCVNDLLTRARIIFKKVMSFI